MKRRLQIIIPPFIALRLPPFDIASIKTVLENHDVQVEIHPYYLDFASFFGGDIYYKLMEENLGDLIFGAILFEENAENIIDYISKKRNIEKSDINCMIQKFKKHMVEFVQDLKIKSYEIVYFHLYTNQLYTSAYISKLIKEVSNSKIVFGGYHCQGESGLSLLKIFKEVDSVIEKEVEISLLKMFNKTIEKKNYKDLDFLGTPDYSYFVNKLNQLSREFIEKYISGYYLQIELTRGCWWNNCSFCTLNCESEGFRVKSKQAIIKDIETIESKYETTQILIYERISSEDWEDKMLEASKKFPYLKTSFNLSFKVIQLQDKLKFINLKRIGANILIGTESFSNGYLKLMNKGQSVLESINLLKLAERYQVPCFHNFMFNFPGEKVDFINETRIVVDFIKHLPPPFDIEKFRLTYGSEIFKKAGDYNIRKIKFRPGVEGIIIPSRLKSIYKPFFWDFEMDKKYSLLDEKEWFDIIESWRKSYYSFAFSGVPKMSSNLFFREKNKYLEIYDRRQEKERIIKLKDVEAQVYKFCDVPRTKLEIYDNFRHINVNKLDSMLDNFINLKIMFEECQYYLSLAI